MARRVRIGEGGEGGVEAIGGVERNPRLQPSRYIRNRVGVEAKNLEGGANPAPPRDARCLVIATRRVGLVVDGISSVQLPVVPTFR